MLRHLALLLVELEGRNAPDAQLDLKPPGL